MSEKTWESFKTGFTSCAYDVGVEAEFEESNGNLILYFTEKDEQYIHFFYGPSKEVVKRIKQKRKNNGD